MKEYEDTKKYGGDRVLTGQLSMHWMEDGIKLLWYMAHPIAAYQGYSVGENVNSAISYLGALNRVGLRVIAPWIGLVQAMGESDFDSRMHGIDVDNETLIRCDGIILCGFKESAGMRSESELANKHGLRVIDVIGVAPAVAALTARKELTGT